jgi:4-amino-4-deoxy-L-arabinose transferase-like glycosyltransferase
MSAQTIPKIENNAQGRRGRIVAALALSLIILLGAFLRFFQLGAYSIGNIYYAATVKSMLTSWHNFFFAAFEPGGSVSVDKPPLGFWVQAPSAYFLGVNGFSLALPNALAGMLSIPLLYSLVKKQFGDGAALVAALVLAVTPVAVSTERNNTIDGLLVFVLLLAIWAVWRSVASGKFRYLLLGAFIVGLGFNIKMLQAYMILPAVYALYLLGAKHAWWKRILHLTLASLVLLVVSLAWVAIVDLTPADSRPYVGSSTDNTEMELIVGHNGLSRLFAQARHGPGNARNDRPAAAGYAQSNLPLRPLLQSYAGQAGQYPAPYSQPGQVPINPPGVNPEQAPSQLQVNPSGNQPNIGSSRALEVGNAGILRLFSEPLVTEASWLLPLVLLGILPLLGVLGWKWPLGEKHLAVVLWAGWLLPVVMYFSFTTGLFHAYYLIMLGPPLAALFGATLWALDCLLINRRWLGWALTALLSGLTLAFEIFTLKNYPQYARTMTAFSLVFWLAGIVLLASRKNNGTMWRANGSMSKLALGCSILGLIVGPLTWSGLTTFSRSADVALPKAGPGSGNQRQNWSTDFLTPVQQKILVYVEANTPAEGYLLATPNAREASPYILATGRPVLTFGGFMGSDNIIDVTGVAQMVAEGDLRFILDTGELTNSKPEIAAWVRQSCAVARVPGLGQRLASQGPGTALVPGAQQQTLALFDCGG